METVFEKTENNKTVKIYLDHDPMNPADWDNLGKIAYLKTSRYTLGDTPLHGEEIEEIANSAEFISIPVYAYVHGSVMLKAGKDNPFTCPWDSAQSGIVYVSREKVIKEYGNDNPETVEKVLEALRAYVDTYSRYLQGAVYGFVLEVDGNETDSCWGYYDDPEKLADMVLKGEV